MSYHDDDAYVVIERHDGNVGSFLMGVAIGAGLALLMAPQSGAATRRGIRRRANRARTAARRVAGEVTETITDTFDQARLELEGRIDAARQAIEVKRRQVQKAVEAGRAAAEDAREDLEQRIAETKVTTHAAYSAGADVARGGDHRGG
jgi:gas vesicle protein